MSLILNVCLCFILQRFFNDLLLFAGFKRTSTKKSKETVVPEDSQVFDFMDDELAQPPLASRSVTSKFKLHTVNLILFVAIFVHLTF